jgi:hypothetical protein
LPVDATGAFRVAGSVAGVFPVRFTGVDHADRTLGLLLDGRELELEVRLGTYERVEPPPAEVSVVLLAASEHGPPRAGRSVPLKRRADGVYTAEIEPTEAADDTILYQVEGIARARTVNGPEADGFVYDGGGDYASRLHVEGRKVTVRVDPAHRLRPGRALPDFSLPALPDGARTPAGTVLTSASLRGKVVLIDFWGHARALRGDRLPHDDPGGRWREDPRCREHAAR